MRRRLTPEGIARAAALLPPDFRDTPLIRTRLFEDVDLALKLELFTPIRSFKGRGTWAYVAQRADPRQPLVCASAGNFGQGLAWAARAHGVPLHVYAATTANPLKVERMRAFGATVVLEGEDFDGAKDAARARAAREGWPFVEDGRELAVSEGAGTIGLELARQGGPFDVVLVPVGNGALVNGVATWLRHEHPGTRLVGVVAEAAPAMKRSWEEGSLVTTPRADTIADGIAVRVPVPEALQDMATLVDEMVAVSEYALQGAMRTLFERLGLVVEPAGVAGFAALRQDAGRYAGLRVATILCGGNLTHEQVRRWLLPG